MGVVYPNKTFCLPKSHVANHFKFFTLKQFVGKLPTNCLSVFDHFLGFALKGFIKEGGGE